MQSCGQVFRYAIATGRAERNPAADLRGALSPVVVKHRASITDSRKVGQLLRDITAYDGLYITRCALRFAPLVFVRPGEKRRAEWSDFDLEKREWRIPAERMKMKEPHIVPLSRQAIAILTELQALTGAGRYLFPGARSVGRPMC
jgi:integrase